MAKSRLELLKEKRDQLNAQIQSIAAKEQAKKRKEDTRRKVLIGAVMLKMVKEGEYSEAQLLEHLDKHLVKQSERDLFGLVPKSLAQ